MNFRIPVVAESHILPPVKRQSTAELRKSHKLLKQKMEKELELQQVLGWDRPLEYPSSSALAAPVLESEELFSGSEEEELAGDMSLLSQHSDDVYSEDEEEDLDEQQLLQEEEEEDVDRHGDGYRDAYGYGRGVVPRRASQKKRVSGYPRPRQSGRSRRSRRRGARYSKYAEEEEEAITSEEEDMRDGRVESENRLVSRRGRRSGKSPIVQLKRYFFEQMDRLRKMAQQMGLPLPDHINMPYLREMLKEIIYSVQMLKMINRSIKGTFGVFLWSKKSFRWITPYLSQSCSVIGQLLRQMTWLLFVVLRLLVWFGAQIGAALFRSIKILLQLGSYGVKMAVISKLPQGESLRESLLISTSLASGVLVIGSYFMSDYLNQIDLDEKLSGVKTFMESVQSRSNHHWKEVQDKVQENLSVYLGEAGEVYARGAGYIQQSTAHIKASVEDALHQAMDMITCFLPAFPNSNASSRVQSIRSKEDQGGCGPGSGGKMADGEEDENQSPNPNVNGSSGKGALADADTLSDYDALSLLYMTTKDVVDKTYRKWTTNPYQGTEEGKHYQEGLEEGNASTLTPQNAEIRNVYRTPPTVKRISGTNDNHRTTPKSDHKKRKKTKKKKKSPHHRRGLSSPPNLISLRSPGAGFSTPSRYTPTDGYSYTPTAHTPFHISSSSSSNNHFRSPLRDVPYHTASDHQHNSSHAAGMQSPFSPYSSTTERLSRLRKMKQEGQLEEMPIQT